MLRPRSFLAGMSLLTATVGLAHSNGIYQLDHNDSVTVTFEYVERCPALEGSLRGGLRFLTFSDAANAEPYLFETGYYVETHSISGGEKYVQTDAECVPTEPKNEIAAEHRKFGGYSMTRQ